MVEQQNPRLPQLPVMLALLMVCSTNVAGVAGDDPAGKSPAAARKVVVLVHGLKQDDGDLQKLSDFLGRDKTLSVLRFGYDSGEDRVEDATEKLIAFVQKEAPKSVVHFVGFSLGNLVIRQYQQRIRKRKLGLKIGRVVMIAPPNHGSLFALKYKGGIAGLFLVGPVFEQLGPGFAKLKPSLDTPSRFGIIAGGKGDGQGFSLKTLPGDDDNYLTVKTTRLRGAADFRLVKLEHEELDDDPLVHKLTLKFLQAGFFETKATRKPI